MDVLKPLVSVPVITYNSSKTVVETLDSIYNQLYPYLELIVSDDCSTDNTVDICRDWIEAHKDRFVRTMLLTVEKNTGVSANCNRAEAVCRGEWVKGIAGDDILLPSCIKNCLDFVADHTEVLCLFGRMEGFGKRQEVVDEYMKRCFDYSFFSLSASEQFDRLVFRGNCVPAPTFFYNLDCFRKLAVINDERIPMVEDYPKWLNLTKKGVKLYLIDKVLVKYRLSHNSISSTEHPSLAAQKSSALIFMYYLFPEYWRRKSKVRALHKYIGAAYMARGGFYWRLLYKVDRSFSWVLNKMGFDVSV